MGSEVIILPALFGSLVWLAYIIVDGSRRKQRLRTFTEFHGKMFDRIGSAKEFGEFFTSEAGTRFLDSLASERGSPKIRILAALQWGLTLVFLGVSIFILLDQHEFRSETVDTLAFIGTVSVGIGAGTLISSFASYLLSRRMGLLSDRRDGTEMTAIVPTTVTLSARAVPARRSTWSGSAWSSATAAVRCHSTS